MSVQHQQFLDLAERLIAKHGRPVVLVESINAGSEYDPDWVESKTGVMAVQTQFEMNDVNGDLVRADDKMFLIDGHAPIDSSMHIRDYEKAAHASIPMGPFTGNPIGVNEEQLLIADYSIVQLGETKPGETITHYEVYARL